MNIEHDTDAEMDLGTAWLVFPLAKEFEGEEGNKQRVPATSHAPCLSIALRHAVWSGIVTHCTSPILISRIYLSSPCISGEV